MDALVGGTALLQWLSDSNVTLALLSLFWVFARPIPTVGS